MNDDQDDVILEPEDENNKQKSPYMSSDSSAEASAEEDEFVPEDGEGNTGTTKDTVKDLREKLKKAIAEKQEYMDGWQRTKADFVNARKREEEARKEMVKFANEDLLMQITPVLDSFTMAMSNKTAWENVDKNWRMGVEYIYSQLKGILEQNGFSEFDPTGETFDPVKHHAIETVEVSEESQDHKVIEVVQKGYLLNGKIVRPASVKIGEYKKST
ncbi:MAG: GrpE protein molecular chaperone GrpE [Candidatus Paceibacter sp.]|jgi:molecular chaperone GrpE|nr:GrpE protein molecular chaperone GrpE [Candidatus Paceibacter sp.]